MGSSLQTTFKFNFVTCKDVHETIKTLKNKTSCSIDGNSPKFVKNIAENIIFPLTKIINQSFYNGIFPECLKIAKVTPIHKKDETDCFDNYRPVSCLSPFSQIFEKIAYKQIYSYLTDKKILYESQHGFRSGHSTETLLI